MRSPEERARAVASAGIEVRVEIGECPHDPTIDGPSNAQVLCAGICTRRALLVLLAVEVSWMLAQLAGRWLLGKCVDPPPFIVLHRANLFLALALLTLSLRARTDARTRERARALRQRLRLAKAEEVRAAIAEGLAQRLAQKNKPLH